jgi:hypothetical protein
MSNQVKVRNFFGYEVNDNNLGLVDMLIMRQPIAPVDHIEHKEEDGNSNFC